MLGRRPLLEAQGESYEKNLFVGSIIVNGI